MISVNTAEEITVLETRVAALEAIVTMQKIPDHVKSALVIIMDWINTT